MNVFFDWQTDMVRAELYVLGRLEPNILKAAQEALAGAREDMGFLRLDAKAFANVKKTISTRTFAYGDVSVLYDTIAKVNHRITIGPGAGIYPPRTAA